MAHTKTRVPRIRSPFLEKRAEISAYAVMTLGTANVSDNQIASDSHCFGERMKRDTHFRNEYLVTHNKTSRCAKGKATYMEMDSMFFPNRTKHVAPRRSRKKEADTCSVQHEEKDL